MKLFGYDINIGRVSNVDKPQPKGSQVVEKIVKYQIVRTQESIKKWRNAIRTAESVLNPDRTELIRVYRDAALDAHVHSLMTSRRLKLLSCTYWLEDASGVINEEATEKIHAAWFRKIMGEVVNTEMYGHTLIQLGPIKNDSFTDIKVVPRENVIPDLHSVKKNVLNTRDLIDYTAPKYQPWIIEIGERDNLGTLVNVAPWAIWKKNVSIGWAEYAEKFGMPIRVGRTDINNPRNKKNMDDMLANMGSAFWATLDTDDMLEIIESNNEDAYQVYQYFIDVANKEISKAIAGQTMTSEDGSSRSQSEVHERLFDDWTTSDKWTAKDVIDNQLLPKMVMHGMIPDGLQLGYDNSEKVGLTEHFDMVKGLIDTGKYTVPVDYITETFNIPVEEAQQMIATLPVENEETESIINEMFNYYKGYTPPHSH